MQNEFLETSSTHSVESRPVPEVRLPESSPPESTAIPLPSNIISLLPLGFILAWAIAILWSGRGKASRDSLPGLQGHHKIPCKNCRFFKDNPYLKCAIHPTIAATKQAIECTDYTPQTKSTPTKQTLDL